VYAAAISEHPVTATAVGEVTGEVLERLGGDPPDLALLFVTEAHAGALEDAARTVRTVLSPTVLLGCAAVAVAGPGREVEQQPAVSLWAGQVGGPVAPFHEGSAPPFEPTALLLLADPFTFDADAFFHDVGVPVYGGMASAGRGPGGNRLALDDRIVTGGAVGAWLGPGVPVRGVVAQGCRGFGNPYVVTKAERNVVYELGGKPAVERLVHGGLDEEEARLVNQGLHLGLVIDERNTDFGPGDFLVRNVIGADRENGAIAVGEMVEVGTTAQYHVRDAATADEDLRRMLAGVGPASAALLFTCNGRGARLFGEPDHDAGVLDEALDGAPVAGFFAAGEFGPVGGRNFVHGFTASVALFD
jgi:small ligand-binding sensory domain FIST